MGKEDIKRYSQNDLDEMAARGDVVPTAPDAPEVTLGEEFWRNADVVMPGGKGKTSVHLRVDTDVLEWFKAQGKGHLTRMNAVLRAYYKTLKDGSTS